MKLSVHTLVGATSIVFFNAALAAPPLPPDMTPVYDESTYQTNAVDSYCVGLDGSSNSMGVAAYDSFSAAISAAYNEDRGGVIDEWLPYSSTSMLIAGSPLTSGIGSTGKYDAVTPANSVGDLVTFTDAGGVSDWVLGNQTNTPDVTSTSNRLNDSNGGSFLILGTQSQDSNIELSTASGREVIALGFTFLAATNDTITAKIHFLDGSSFTQIFSVTDDKFFGANAPAGASIDYFRITGASGISDVYIDDIALIVIPEPSTAMLGLASCALLLSKRRR
jgi:hypothetical protein